jgi:acetyl esterase/lipase
VVPPDSARTGEGILHIHGGWFNWGSAQAFRHLVGHLAARARVEAIVPDYRLPPEHPFPAAAEDVRASYFALIERGYSKIAVTGRGAADSEKMPIGAAPDSPNSFRSWCTPAVSNWT